MPSAGNKDIFNRYKDITSQYQQSIKQEAQIKKHESQKIQMSRNAVTAKGQASIRSKKGDNSVTGKAKKQNQNPLVPTPKN